MQARFFLAVGFSASFLPAITHGSCPNPLLINPPETNRSFSSINGLGVMVNGKQQNTMSWIDSPWGWFPMYSPSTAAATPGVSPGEVYKDESMIIDMLSDMSIAGFAIQAGITDPLDGKVRWVNSFTAEYRKNGENGLTSVDNGDVFDNYPNVLAKGKYATVFFKKSVVARYFKLHVKTFEGEIPAIRVGLLKCPVQTTQPPSPQTTQPTSPQTTRPPNPQTTRPPSSQTTRPESCPIQSVVSTDNTITFSGSVVTACECVHEKKCEKIPWVSTHFLVSDTRSFKISRCGQPRFNIFFSWTPTVGYFLLVDTHGLKIGSSGHRRFIQWTHQ